MYWTAVTQRRKVSQVFFGAQLHSIVSQLLFVVRSRWTANINYCSPHCAWHRPTSCKPTSRLCIWKEHEFLMVTRRGGLHWYDFPFPLEKTPPFFFKGNFWPYWFIHDFSCIKHQYWWDFTLSFSLESRFSKLTFGPDWPIHAMWLYQQRSVNLLWGGCGVCVCGCVLLGVLVYFSTKLFPAASTTVAVCWTVP